MWLRVGVSAAIPAMALAGAAATGAAQSATILFDIASQPVDRALERFSQVTGVQVMYQGRAGPQPHSRGFKGLASAEEALDALLRDTGLRVRQWKDRTVILTDFRIERAASAMAASGEPRPPVVRLEQVTVRMAPIKRVSYDWYGAIVHREVDRAIRAFADDDQPLGRYIVQLWIASDGSVGRYTVEAPGRRSPARLDGALRQLRIGTPPPAAMPQPVILRVSIDG